MVSEFAVKVDALVTRILLPALRVRGLDPADDIVPAPAKPKAVSETEIVSREETEERAPLLTTIPLIVFPTVGADIAPPTFNVPEMVVLPVTASTVNLSELTRKSPATASVPPIVALLVTSSPVPAAEKRDDPVKVLAEVPVWV